MNEIIIAAIAACGGALVAGVFSILQWRLTRNAQKEDARSQCYKALEAGVQILLYDRIKHRAKRYIMDGQISADDLEDILHMHTIYHDDLNGNGYLDSMIDSVRKLPIK